ncbi:MAG: MaoC family dehydratase [Pseudomonadota bacterium]
MPEIGIHARGLPGLAAEHAAIPVWNSENWYYEDFTVGEKIRSIRRTISEGEAMLFNALVLDMHPYVADQPFAEKEGVFGKRLVAGAMVFSYGLGLAATNCLNSFSYGYDRLRFIAPVFIGDTIYTIRENLAKEIKSDTMGKVRVSYSVFKGEGEIVLYCEHLMTALYREPARFKSQVAKIANAAKKTGKAGKDKGEKTTTKATKNHG